MVQTDTRFIFSGYEADLEHGSIRFRYQLTAGTTSHDFTEILSFAPLQNSERERIPEHLMHSVLDALHLVLGISYWKTYCPRQIELTSIRLTKDQAQFWNALYTKGLGEFFYRNAIDFRGLVQFPFESGTSVNESFPQALKDRSLVLLGGGKDSIVTAELFKKHSKDFTLFSLNEWPVINKVAQTIGNPLLVIHREIDPKLFELIKKSGVFNGHIPITAVFSLTGLLAAVLYNYNAVIASNERSASYGNVTYLGEEINHQWSKSFEFEQMLTNYITTYITGDIKYFSLLRPLTELNIMRIFSNYKKYFGIFTSCNKNFTQGSSRQEAYWCGECAKCAFVFLLLSAYIPKNELLDIFHKNLFASEKLTTTYKELLGLEGFKPFECVGTPEESVYAFLQMLQRGEFSQDYTVRTLAPVVSQVYPNITKISESVLSTTGTSGIPEEFRPLLETL